MARFNTTRFTHLEVPAMAPNIFCEPLYVTAGPELVSLEALYETKKHSTNLARCFA